MINHQEMIYPFPFVLLRCPVQSLQNAYDFSREIEPIFEEGLYLSSPDFWAEFKKKDQTDKDREKMALSFAKYWIRSCTRCTPYGTFAGSAVVDLTDGDTNIRVDDSQKHIRRLRLDMNYITEVIRALVKLPAIQRQINYFVNNSLYELPESYRYVEYQVKDNIRSYDLNSIKKTGYLTTVLDRAARGATIGALTDLLALPGTADREEAEAYIIDLCESQVLSPALEPCVTGNGPLEQLIQQLESLKGVEGLSAQLRKVNELISNPVEGVAHYQNIEKELAALGTPVSISGNTVQTDLFLSLQNNKINKDLVEAIVAEVSDLLVLSRPMGNKDLEKFKDRFYERFEEREVPLAEALDSELGIGYAGIADVVAGKDDLIADLKTSDNTPQETAESNYITDFAAFKYYDFLKNKRPHIEITQEDLSNFRNRKSRHIFPDSMYLMGNLMKKNGALNPQDFIFDITVITGPSAANLFGRFTQGDETLLQRSREILRQEGSAKPDAIYAEIVHLPQARMGNVLLRPVLRDYEIPYVGRSGANPEDQISINDLMVSIRQGEIVLRSRKFDRRVIPRLTTAHNFGHNNLPIYKFLCDLQAQGYANPAVWDWGPLSGLKYFPRVVYKNLVIRKARWKIDSRDVDQLPEGSSASPGHFLNFRDKFGLPQKVLYYEGDSKLLLDFGHPNGIALFLHFLKRHNSLVVEEFLFDEGNCLVSNINNEVFTNEIIIPLLQKAQAIDPGGTVNRPQNPVKRKFSPFSEWLYFKIYCGPKFAETVLSTKVLEFIEDGLRQQIFEKFFFIRFRDEAPHFRIRFYNSTITRQSELQRQFTQLLQPFLENGLVDKIVLDTYTREIERYGEDLVDETESLFHNDSLAVLRFISLLEGPESERYRLLFALRGIDMMLTDFKYDLGAKVKLLGTMQTAFFSEFGARLELQRQLDERYRIYQKGIFSHMDPENDARNEVEAAVELFKIRSVMHRPIVDAILQKLPDPVRGHRLAQLLPSYIHMFMNRIFIGNQRKYELVTYHFLNKYYASQLAISKFAAKPTV
jgi:thiopeptide-type bacteriocin biosynthesis protein